MTMNYGIKDSFCSTGLLQADNAKLIPKWLILSTQVSK